jgi:cyclic-di-GMP phosphodiesterase, flagellum assembly factor TipF
MTHFVSLFVNVSIALVSAAAGVMLHDVLGFSVASSIILGALLFLFAEQVYALVLRNRERTTTASELARLLEQQQQFRLELGETNKCMSELAATLDQRTTARGEKVMEEVKLLEGLVRDFADGIGERVAALETQGLTGARALQHALGDAAVRGGFSRPMGIETLGDADLLAAIRHSLVENRVDLFLQPIVSLPQRRLRFYEAFTRLRTEEGTAILPQHYLRVAEPAGLMSAIDNLLLFRCVQLIRRLSRSARDISIFCNISAHSLSDATFFPQFLEFMQANKDLAPHIVFEFEQKTLDAMAKTSDANLRVLADLGFAFSLDHVEHLNLDFSLLRERRFRFIKAHVKLLLTSETALGGIVAGDLKELVSRHGLYLIGEKIEDERDVVNLLEFGVDYGQGFLFGEPRPLRETLGEAAQPTKPVDTKQRLAG